MADLSMTYSDLCDRVGIYMGYGSDSIANPAIWNAKQVKFIQQAVSDGIRKVYYNDAGHEWKFFHPLREMTVWPKQSALVADINNLNYSSPNTTITMESAWSGSFYETMVGQTILFDSGNTYGIITYTSGSVIVVSGDCSGETGGFTIAAGDYRLPDDFNGLRGVITYEPLSGGRGDEIEVTGTSQIRTLRLKQLSATAPRFAAVEPLRSNYNSEQKYDLQLFPEPDEALALLFESPFNPPAPDSTDYPRLLGGPHMAEVYKKACLAAAEENQNSPSTVKRDEFAIALAGAIARDAKSKSPEIIGYNGNRRTQRSREWCNRRRRSTFRIIEGDTEILSY